MCTVVYFKRTGDGSACQGRERRTLGEDGRDGQDATPAALDVGLMSKAPKDVPPPLNVIVPRVSAFHAAVPIEEFRRTRTQPASFVAPSFVGGAAYPLKRIEDVARNTLRDAILMGDRHAAEVSRAIVLLLDEISPGRHAQSVALTPR